MKISKLLSSRQALLHQAHLANLAYSYSTLRRLADRVAKARLCGAVRLRATSVDADDETSPAALIALEGSQSVIEEHFTDEDVLQLADAIEFALESDFAEVEFALDELGERFAAPLRRTLDLAGIIIDQPEMIADNTPAGDD
jgi:hypothetical protein